MVGKQLAALDLQIGDVISFQARVTAYEKGYKGYRDDVYKPIEIDYRLSNPTKIARTRGPPAQTTAPLCLLGLLKLGKEFNMSKDVGTMI
jgi:hypothetical protein